MVLMTHNYFVFLEYLQTNISKCTTLTIIVLEVANILAFSVKIGLSSYTSFGSVILEYSGQMQKSTGIIHSCGECVNWHQQSETTGE